MTLNMRTVVLLLVALVAAGGTAMFANSWLAKQRPVTQVEKAPEPEAAPVVEVLVAAKEIRLGSFVKPEQLTWQPWPEEGLVDGYMIKGTAKPEDLTGAVARTRLYPGEPITAARVVHPGEQGFLAAVLEPGKRAVSVPVDATVGVGGFIYPGDFVDVILTIRASLDVEGGKDETRHFSQTLLNDVRVLGIDQTSDNEGGQPRVAKTATLEVSPKDAEKVAIAMQMGDLSLSLRSLARDEIGLDGIISRVSTRPNHRHRRSYTRDTDVLFMMGDPWGLPYPAGLTPKVNVLRGDKAEIAKF